MTTGQETLLQEITAAVEGFARQRSYALGKSSGRILRELVRMHQEFGQFYCPCQPENSEDTVCVCAEVRGGYVEEMGRCHCGLFIAV